jgi:hypothetical protein
VNDLIPLLFNIFFLASPLLGALFFGMVINSISKIKIPVVIVKKED